MVDSLHKLEEDSLSSYSDPSESEAFAVKSFMAASDPSTHLILEGRLDIFAVDRASLVRAATYDRGSHWQAEWHALPGLPAFPFGNGPVAVAGSADGRVLHLFSRMPEILPEKGIFHARSRSDMSGWDVRWTEVGNGKFVSAPAAATSGGGGILYVCGRGTDQRFWLTKSSDAGASWDFTWNAIGQGLFTSRPAITTSPTGRTVIIVGRGTDSRFYLARSLNSAGGWEAAWDPIQEGKFSSAPAVALAADGSALYAVGRGTDDKLWWNRSGNLGKAWRGWEKIPKGVFASGPSAVTTWNGDHLYVSAIGTDMRVWIGASFDRGENWPIAFSPVLVRTFQ